MITDKERAVLPTIDWQILDDRILIQRFEPVTKIGLIIIPDTAQAEANKGIVLSVGEFVQYDDTHPYAPRKGRLPNVGDVVLFGKYAGAEFEEMVDGKMEKLVTMRITDVMAIRKTNFWNEPA